MNELVLHPVAYIHNDYKEKFGIPRQSGIAKHLVSTIVPVKEYIASEAFRGIEGYEYLWLIFGFSENDPKENVSLTVRPPKLGGNERIGVFATRSPYRPNPIGLSCVKLEKVEEKEGETILTVSGADLMDGTPVYDIKPYVAYADSHANAKAGIATDPSAARKEVTVDVAFPENMSEIQRISLLESLGQDPRPGYHKDETRVYGFLFGKWNVKFCCQSKAIHVIGFDDVSE